jgi:hypothetical protein
LRPQNLEANHYRDDRHVKLGGIALWLLKRFARSRAALELEILPLGHLLCSGGGVGMQAMRQRMMMSNNACP